MNADIQHTQMVMGAVYAAVAAGVMLVALAGRWLGGVWTTLAATTIGCLLAYPPLVGVPVFSNYQTDIPRRILIATVPFAVTMIVLSFKNVPWLVRLLFALIEPAVFLGWIFLHFDPSVPRHDLMVHKIAPIAGVIFIAWALIEPLAIRSPGAAAPILVTAFTAGVAFILVLSAENLAGLIGPIIPATAGGALLAAIAAGMFGWKITFARGPVLLWLMLIAAIFAFMWLDIETLPTTLLLWMAAAIPLAWIPELGPIRRLKPWKRELLRGLLVLAPVVTGMTLAWKQHSREAAESGDPYGLVYPDHSPAPNRPSATPIISTINPPTIT